MTPSTSPSRVPLHVAIIMDGNGRWATARGLPRTAGHRAGADAVRRVVESAPRLGVGALTLFAFSSDNWKRPAREVTTLMRLFVIGRRDRLAPALIRQIDAAERLTADGRRLHLRLAVDYSAREAITRSVRDPSSLGPDVDLLVRTGGERRLSDFLLWECAYAELHFTDKRWPDFSAADLERALADFHTRERRFGALSA